MLREITLTKTELKFLIKAYFHPCRHCLLKNKFRNLIEKFRDLVIYFYL